MIEMHWGKLSEGGGRYRWEAMRFLPVERPCRADWMKTATMWQFSEGAKKGHFTPPILDNKK